MKFRKKPILIDAKQFTGDNWRDIFEWGDQNGITITGSAIELTIATYEGNMTALPNDWIIKGVNGELYPCKPDIFEKTYEKV